MLNKLTLFVIAFIMTSAIMAQQSRYVMKPGGELIKLDAKTDVRTAIQKANITDLSGKPVKSIFPDANIISTGILDTLTYYDPSIADYSSRFGFFGQDVMLTWHVAPAEMVIKAIGVKPAIDDVLGNQISVRLLKFNWTLEELNSFTAAQYLGYYPSVGDGFNNVAAYPEDAIGNWVDKSGGAYPSPPWDHGAYDLWSDFGFGWPIEPVGISSSDPAYQWVETAPLGEPHLQQGEIFAIAVTHDGVILDDERIGFWAMDASATGNWSWKFYENGRFDATVDPGWWAREFTFDFVAAVNLIGDRGPQIHDFTKLQTTIDLGPQYVYALITDDNPSGGPAGVASAEIIYSVNGGVEQSTAMQIITEANYKGEIPGMNSGDEITYYIKTTDVEGNITSSAPVTYQIFIPLKDILVVVNGYSTEDRMFELVPYYFDLIGILDDSDYDLWYYGPVSSELLSYYNMVIEIQMCEGMPTDDNRDVYSAWVAEGNKNFLLAGQEQLGFLYGYADQIFGPGDFEYDVLGVLNSYNDRNYGISGDQLKPSIFAPQFGSLLGNSLALFMDTLNPDTLLYDPIGILGETDAQNWFDQFDPRDDVFTDVFMKGLSHDNIVKPAGHSWVTPSNSKVAFMAYDPLVLVQAGGETWVAALSIAPFHQAVRWLLGDELGGDSWSMDISFSDAGGRAGEDISIGQKSNATDGIDIDLGESELPPPPPTGAFDLRCVLPTNQASLIDYRGNELERIEWEIQFQPGPDGYPITLSWNPVYFNITGSLRLTDAVDGSLINVDMTNSSQYVVSNDAISKLKIVFSKEACSDYSYMSGWNLLSIPLVPADNSKDALFPNSTSNAFLFNNGYQIADSLNTGIGYWLKFGSSGSTQICGTPVNHDIEVKTGWNMIGVFNNSVDVDQITSTPAGIVSSNYFGFNNGYQIMQTLNAGGGYWIKVNQDGLLHLDGIAKIRGNGKPGIDENWAKVQIEDANRMRSVLYFSKNDVGEIGSLPPKPPAGIFDVRFSDDRYVETAGEIWHTLEISGASYPLNIISVDENLDVTLISGEKEEIVNLGKNESISIGENTTSVQLRGKSLLPIEFNLAQNYPNPFNPSTIIKYGIPENARVKIDIYNSIGQRVRTIVDQHMEAGYHEIQLNANQLASGVYFYRIHAGNFIDTKKMLLIK